MGTSQSSWVNWAAEAGRADDLVYYLDSVKDKKLCLSYVYGPKKWTPIHSAAARGHQQCIRILWEAGSKLTIRDKDGYAPIHLASFYQHLYCVRLLVQLGASVGLETKNGVNALHLAASVGNSYIAEDLVKLGAFTNAQECWGNTALMIAAGKSRTHTMATLLSLGADAELHDYHHGYTALHIAVNTRDEANVLTLLDAKARLDSTDKEDLSPLGLALINKFYSVVPLLLEYGGKLSTGDRQVLPTSLQDYIDKRAAIPLSQLQISRVELRQSLGPSKIDTLPTLGLEPDFEAFVKAILDVCEGSEVKQVTMQAYKEIERAKMPFEQFETDTKYSAD